jgi:hypothetical protein
MSALYDVMPDIVPKPLGWETYENQHDVHFFLCNFNEMTDDIPDVTNFPSMLAQLHKNGVSPNGKFGFPHYNIPRTSSSRHYGVWYIGGVFHSKYPMFV